MNITFFSLNILDRKVFFNKFIMLKNYDVNKQKECFFTLLFSKCLLIKSTDNSLLKISASLFYFPIVKDHIMLS